jgi:hypothetical protein
VVGDCLSISIADAVRRYAPQAEVLLGRFDLPNLSRFTAEAAERSTVVFAQTGLTDAGYPTDLQAILDPHRYKTVHFPKMVFPAFHPDCIYPWDRRTDAAVRGPLGAHSAIVIEGRKRGMDAATIEMLFNETTFERLGYFGFFEPSLRALVAEFDSTPVGSALIDRWLGRCFMHSVNHPKAEVVWDMADRLLRLAGYQPAMVDRTRGGVEAFELGPRWAVYPEIAQRLRVAGGYHFLYSTDYSPGSEHVSADLTAFVRSSIDALAGHDMSQIALSRPTTGAFEQIDSEVFDDAFAAGARATRAKPAREHPYAGLEPHQFWRTAVAAAPAGARDPMTAAPFTLDKATRVATAGSCFAQHIATALQQSGFHYLVTEPGPERLDPAEARRRNYGVFSARYGNIYTPRQLLQLLQRVYGTFKPIDTAWSLDSGRLVDPFRPTVEPEGFETVEALEAARQDHFAAVRALVEQAEVFVFTLGLTEAWRRRTDGAVFPVAPGVAGGRYDPGRHDFVNFGVSEVVQDLFEAIALIRSKSPWMKFILTVSPVPLAATYEPAHVLTATTYSKSVLRVAAEEIARKVGDVAYFPSYEIITGPGGAFFEDDLRTIRPEGVAHVMEVFFRHFTGAVTSPSAPESPAEARGADTARSRIASLLKTVCDEDLIEPYRPEG